MSVMGNNIINFKKASLGTNLVKRLERLSNVSIFFISNSPTKILSQIMCVQLHVLHECMQNWVISNLDI